MKGKVYLMAGDARQIGAVVEFGGEAETYQASIMSSHFYRANVQVFRLSKTMRNIGDPAFSKMVDRIGDGLLSPDADGSIEIHGLKTETDIESSIDYVFPPEVLRDPLHCAKRRAIITPLNVTGDDINDLVLSRVEGEVHVLEVRSVLDHENLEFDLNDAFCMSEHLCTVHHSGVPSHTLRLKVGIVIMLTRTLDISQGLCNSSKLVVLGISLYTLRVKTLTEGIEHFIPRITFGFITKQGVAVKRVQFPFRLCFAVTIHKSQGQTLDKVLFDNRTDVFMHGCLYVALSRVRAAKDIRIVVQPCRVSARGFASKSGQRCIQNFAGECLTIEVYVRGF